MDLKIQNKIGITVAIAALILSIVSLSTNKKIDEPLVLDQNKIKEIVIDTIKQNPQLVMDTMGDGLAQQREAAIKQVIDDVKANKDEIAVNSLLFGKIGAKAKVICFFDPLCKHCILFQHSMMDIIKLNKEIEFQLIPVAVLSEDSAVIAKLYIAAYDIDRQKSESFIKKLIELGEHPDMQSTEKALISSGYSMSEIEKKMPDAEKRLIANTNFAQKIKLPVVPGIFLMNNSNVIINQDAMASSILKFFEE